MFKTSDDKKEENRWMVEIVAKCLIWLGDLNRYRLEILEGKLCHTFDSIYLFMRN